MYEKLLEKAEAQGFKFKNGVPREIIKQGQEDSAAKSEKYVLAKSIDIYKDDANEGEGAELAHQKNDDKPNERNYSEISQAYDEIQSMHNEGKTMKRHLGKRAADGELDSIIEFEELQLELDDNVAD